MLDENGVPRGVQEAADMAEELHARMFTTEEPVNEDTPTVELVTDEEVVDDEEEVIEDPKEEKKFRDKYMTLKGKYDAEVPRLAAELRELRDAINKPKAVEAPAEDTTEDDYMSTVSEEYGEDFINAIRKVIQHEVKPIVKPVQEQAQNIQNTQTEAQKESFKTYLDTKVDKGDWRELWDKGDPNFVEFLAQPDPSGLYTYGDLVDMYNEQWDGDRLAKVLNTYFETQEKPTNTRTNTSTKQKDALIAPNRTNAQPSPNTDTKRMWTMQSFQEFQRDDRMGKYTPEESERLWNDAAIAPSEGRMR